MQRYKEYVKKMIDENKKLFAAFQKIHDKYCLNQSLHQEKYNIEGEKALEVVREYENRVCSNTERGMYNKFSANLADKFQKEVRKVFPMIDHVGLKIEKPKFSINGIFPPQPQPAVERVESSDNFTIKKIELV